ncbi:RDD family protein [Streptococcus pantholopis]|uniref:RDD family protein n=1 Tax=Streptococcus pantholopis TaxID=1811193 RepID=A0A172Q9Q5_9STRE|nr:RDD family protein [Streptococcus pantholopis]AND80243.1 RDD family protein [Streptococcus pantholopis]
MVAANNDISLKSRIKELFVDYLLIISYLVILLLLSLSFYVFIFGKIPSFTLLQSQLIAGLTSVVPVVIGFSWLDYCGGSFGKRKAGLRLSYQKKTFLAASIRNIIKFFPWQLGHMGTIDGIYTDYTSLFGHICTSASLILLFILLWMGLFRKDKRHLGDLLAGTQVVKKESEAKTSNSYLSI